MADNQGASGSSTTPTTGTPTPATPAMPAAGSSAAVGIPPAGTTIDMRGMTDNQLRQTWSQIATAANLVPGASTAYAAPTPQAPPNKGLAYMRNVQAWSTSASPAPRAGAASVSTRPTRARSTRNAGSATPTPTTPAPAMPIPPTAVAGGVQQQQQPSGATSYVQPIYSHPMMPIPVQNLQQQSQYPQAAAAGPIQPIQQHSAFSNPPKAPLPTTPQALQSTYASRMKTGVSLLMQPVFASTTSALLGGTGRPSRRGAVINYADPGSGDDLPDAGELDSDDSEFATNREGRGAVVGTRLQQQQQQGGRGGSLGVFGNAAGAGSSYSSPAPQVQKAELDQSYLGMVPPSRLIKPKPVPMGVGGPTGHDYPPPDSVLVQAYKRSSLVPIRVEFETDSHRVRDCFAWNIHEELIRPEAFARIFCNDLDLPLVPWVETVTNQIKAQLEEYQDVALMDIGMDAAVEPDDLGEGGDEMPECRVILSIDVQIANHHLLDHIEWDLLSPLTPEEFARTLCKELGLTGEAIPLVAHAVHEELVKHKRDAIEWGVIGPAGPAATGENKEATPALGEGAQPEKRDRSGYSLLKDKTGLGLGWGRAPRDGRGPKVLRSVWRDWAEAEEFSTSFDLLTAEDLERREVERERASRRLRRETSKFQSAATGRMRNLRYR
ncbi:SNF5-domain-containing protein [Coprinopsis marcescibilis]|uniref:SNF5-domain-containing protein n=1 Tax=Coprinopsis marcescibilis TaxID=230819 RepID=A0A5C3L9Q9_COPMA|nr:SNF5-domain-containing protein [Coprinopsis marcescibilis]